MPSSSNLNKNQLRLFMTGDELWQHVDSSVDAYWDEPGTPEYSRRKQATFDHKLDQAKARDNGPGLPYIHGAGTHRSLNEFGYRSDIPNAPLDSGFHPRVLVGDDMSGTGTSWTMGEGHHRVVAAADLERQGKRTVFLPINYGDINSDEDY